jgi:WD40 repeat protein
LVSGSRDKSIRIWDVEKGEEVPPSLEGHEDGVRSISITPDGRYIASGSYDHNIKIWDFNTHKEITTLREHKGTVWSVCFDPYGGRLVSGSSDETVRIWNVKADGVLKIKILKTIKAHTDKVLSVCFGPDGKLIASGSAGDDCSIKIWNAKTYNEVAVLKGHSSGVFSLRFSLDGKFLISGSADSTIRIWDVNSRKCLHTIEVTQALESFKMDVTGMKIKGRQGLSEDRYRWLLRHGAIDVK